MAPIVNCLILRIYSLDLSRFGSIQSPFGGNNHVTIIDLEDCTSLSISKGTVEHDPEVNAVEVLLADFHVRSCPMCYLLSDTIV